MNNTTLGNTSWLTIFYPHTVIPNILTLILQLPANIYILQLIISRHWITSEYYTFKTAIFEIFVSLYDILVLIVYCFPNIYLLKIAIFFLGFVITGRPCLLTLICVERYLAVVKPVVFLRCKSLKCKLAVSGIIWLLTLSFCSGRLLFKSFRWAIILQSTLYCVVMIYCCIATLVVLKQPGPGEGVRQGEGMNNMKLKAFRIILIITVSVITIYVPLTTTLMVRNFLTVHVFQTLINVYYTCSIFTWFVQALLFFQRAGKLTFIKWP